jgi:endogenous inhibitor of DNA gyrase (YacG/DUF329 family)
MAMVQLKCPETGKPVDIRNVETAPEVFNLAMHIREIPCPHCGEGHTWTSSEYVRAMMTLRDSPDASRILVDGESATALPQRNARLGQVFRE